MSLFNSFKEMVYKKSEDTYLVKLPEPQTNLIGEAAKTAISADVQQERSAIAGSQALQRGINAAQNAANKIEQARLIEQQHRVNNIIANIKSLGMVAKNQINNSPQMLADNPVDGEGNHYNISDINDHSIGALRDSVNGVIEGGKSGLSKGTLDYINNYANQIISQVDQHSLAFQKKYALNHTISSLKATLPDRIQSLTYNMSSEDPKVRKQALEETKSLISNIENLSAATNSPSQIKELDEMAVKVSHFGRLSFELSKLDNAGHSVYDAYNFEALTANQQQKIIQDNIFLGKPASQMVLNAGGDSMKNMYAAIEAKRMHAAMASSKNVMLTMENMAASENPIAQNASKFYAQYLNKGKGLELIGALNPGSSKYINEIQNPTTPQAYMDAINNIRTLSHTYNIPENYINGITPAEGKDLKEIVYGTVNEDESGNITGVNLNKYDPEVLNQMKSDSEERQGQMVFGNTPESNTAKFLRLMPSFQGHFFDDHDVVLNSVAFNPKVQTYASSLPVYKNTDNENAIDGVSNYRSLVEYVKNNRSDFGLNQISSLSGIPEDELAKQIATKSILMTHDAINTGTTLAESVQMIQAREQSILNNLPVFSGTRNGVDITVTPQSLVNYIPNVKSESEALDVIGQASMEAYNKHVAEMASYKLSEGNDRYTTAAQKGLKEALETASQDYNWALSDMTAVTKNGVLKLMSPDGEEITVTQADFRKAAQVNKEQNEQIQNLVDKEKMDLVNPILYLNGG